MATIDKYKLKIEVDGAEQVVDLEESLISVSNKFAAAAAAGTAAFTALGSSAIILADRIVDISKATGISAAEVYNLSRALEASGGDFNSTEQILSSFSRALGQVERGSQDTIDSLYALGLSKGEIEGLSDQQLYARVIDGLAGMEDGFAKTEIAMRLLGKGAATLDFDQLAEEMRKPVDPELNKQLQNAADAVGAIETAYRELQIAALQALGPIIEYIKDLNFTSDDAKEAIRILGALIAAAFAAAVVTRILQVVQAVKTLAAATRAAGAAQAFLVGLTGVGLAAVAAAGVAATAAYVALGEAMEGAADAKAELEGGTGTAPAATGTGTARTVGQSPQQKEAEAARATTEQLREQIRIQNEYQTTLNNTIGLRDTESELIKAIAEIDKKFAEDKLNLENKINQEKAKGKDANQDVVIELQRQLQILTDQLPVLKQLKTDEITRRDILKESIEFNKQFNQYNNSLLKMYVEEEGLHRLRLELLEKSGDELKKASEEYNIIAGMQSNILNLTSQLVGLNEQLGSTEIVDLQTEVYAWAMKNIDAQEELAKAEDRRLALADSFRSIVEKIPEEFQEQAAFILYLIDLENQRYIKQKQNLEELLEKEKELRESYTKGAEKALEDLADSVQPFEVAMDAVNSVISGIDNALTEFVKNGKFNFKDFARSILADMALIIARALVMRAILAIVGAISPTAATALSGYIGFGGARANGGPVMPGRAYLVGEKGPELAMFDRPGTIVPNNQLAMAGGGSTTVNYNISAVDAQSFRSLVARDPAFIYNVTEVGRRSNPSRRLA